jgi:uncharacterized protein YfiM (DUF2279 family)
MRHLHESGNISIIILWKNHCRANELQFTSHSTVQKQLMLKTVLLILVIFLLTACAATAQNKSHRGKRDPWLGEDKVYHFLTSSVIGAAATKIAVNNNAAPCDAVFIGISTTFVIGSGKEWYDKTVKKTFFSWKDMAWNIAGGTLGSLAVGGC